MSEPDQSALSQPRSLSVLLQLLAFIKPYTRVAAAALVALVLTAGVTLAIGQGVRMVIDLGFMEESRTHLKYATLFMLAMILLLALGTFTRFYLVSWIGERVSADLRQRVFERVLTLHPGYFEENRSGEIMSRLTTDTTLLQSIIGSSLSMALRSSLMLLGGLIMLVVTHWKLTLLVLASVPLVLVPLIFLGRRVRALSRQSQDSVAGVGTYAGEIIHNIKVVQSYTREPQERDAFAREVEQAFAIAKKRIQQRACLIALVILLVFGAISVMLWVGGQDVLSGRMTAGELGAFVFYAVLVASSVATLSEVYGELQRAAGATERLLELLNVESDIQVVAQPRALPPVAKGQPLIELQNVCFCYPSRPGQHALDHVSLAIPPGRTVAIVGPSGAGKSTLYELLLRFYDPHKGRVLFHGIDIRQLDTDELRQRMGLVPQQPVLFSADVWHNIRYGNPEASDEAVIEAAKKAHAHEFIKQLPQGYSSYLGEQGVRLSGGQKQRIALARAILKDPEVLLLDEATSALDAESEAYVQAALNVLMRAKTTLVIAHRLATVVDADHIILMDRGRIMAQGNHQTLLAQSSLYRRLCELQFEKAG